MLRAMPRFGQSTSIARLTLVGALLYALLAAGWCAAADNTKPENQATEPSLLGGWRADSVSIATDGGKVKTITQQDGILSAVISEKTLTLRLGENVLAEMTYSLDTQAKPWTIDMQSKDGVCWASACGGPTIFESV